MTESKARIVTCSHPCLYPTDWDQPKPASAEIRTCECGHNWCCPVCGYGESVWPCKCMIEAAKEQASSDLHKDALGEMAKWLSL